MKWRRMLEFRCLKNSGASKEVGKACRLRVLRLREEAQRGVTRLGVPCAARP